MLVPVLVFVPPGQVMRFTETGTDGASHVSKRPDQSGTLTCREARLPAIESIVAVHEPEFAMNFGVPQGWRRVRLPPPSEGAVRFSVAYESRVSGEDDRFADYVLVELTEGETGGGFVSNDGAARERTRIDGHPAVLDTLRIPDFPVSGGTIDLFVRQASLTGPGYHLGLYAIGTCGEETAIREAFAVLIETFRLERRPFGAF